MVPLLSIVRMRFRFFASRCGISGDSRPAILGIVRFVIRDSVPLSSGESSPSDKRRLSWHLVLAFPPPWVSLWLYLRKCWERGGATRQWKELTESQHVVVVNIPEKSSSHAQQYISVRAVLEHRDCWWRSRGSILIKIFWAFRLAQATMACYMLRIWCQDNDGKDPLTLDTICGPLSFSSTQFGGDQMPVVPSHLRPLHISDDLQSPWKTNVLQQCSTLLKRPYSGIHNHPPQCWREPGTS